MNGRLIASTDPEDYGYEWYGNLEGYFYVEPGSPIKPSQLRRVYDKYTGRECGFEAPDGKVYDYEDLPDIGISQYYPEVDDLFHTDLDNIMYSFNDTRYGYVACGSAGLWYGTRQGGKFIKDMDDLLKTISGYDDVKIYDENGVMVLYMIHHDGTNILELKEITMEGNRWLEDNENELSDWELIDTLFKNPRFSTAPFIADRAYGKISQDRKPKAKRKCASRCTKPMVKSIPKKAPAKKTASKCLKPKVAAKKAPAKKKVLAKKTPAKKPTLRRK